MSEIWKPVVGFEALYEVSDLGRVRRISKRQGAAAGRILRGKKNADGYIRITLCNAPNKDIQRFAHVLVLTAFVGPCPVGQESRHLDGCPENNRLENLCWGTPEQNKADRMRHGNIVSGARHGQAILSPAEVNSIRSSTDPQREIANRFGISQQHVSDIKTGKRW